MDAPPRRTSGPLAQEGSEEVIRRYAAPLYRLAFSILGDRAEAEDATQEAFLRIHAGLPSFRRESCVFSWMYAITRNHCLRIQKQRRALTFARMEDLMAVASSETGESGLREEERQRCIAQVREGCLLGLVRCLNLPQRTAFVLHTLLGLPAEETAEVLGKSANAALILASRAREKVRLFLCRHCSIYQPGNACRCEDMIAFSLKHGWIDPSRPGPPALDPASIAGEVDELKRLILLYKGIPDGATSPGLSLRLKQALERSTILGMKKVK